jgi:dTDP-4-dehydrorhamnose reductase
MARRLAAVRWKTFEVVGGGALSGPLDLVDDSDWVIQCIGLVKPRIREDQAPEVARALEVNGLFPHRLAAATEGRARVLQIATDCVYSGARGGYREADAHDALDVYGKTKSLGEVRAPHVHHLRCSIVGPEPGTPRSLLEWFLGQAPGAGVNGFVNHRWNGVTTLHFALLCAAIVEGDLELPHLVHVLPRGSVTKYEMLRDFGASFGREDVQVRPTEAPVALDRTLASDEAGRSRALWTAAAYAEPPDVPQMLRELAAFRYRGKSSAPALAGAADAARQQ